MSSVSTSMYTGSGFAVSNVPPGPNRVEIPSDLRFGHLAIFPPFAVVEKSGTMPNIPLRSTMPRVYPSTAWAGNDVQEIGVELSTLNYAVFPRALGKTLRGSDVNDYIRWFGPLGMEIHGWILEMDMHASVELAMVASVQTSFPIAGGTGANATAAWTNFATADAIADANVAVNAMATNGTSPNLIVMNDNSWRRLHRQVNFRNAYINTREARIPSWRDQSARVAAAEVLGVVGDILVLPGRFTTSAEGATATTYGPLWPDADVLFCRVAEGWESRVIDASQGQSALTAPSLPQAGIGHTYFRDNFEDGGLGLLDEMTAGLMAGNRRLQYRTTKNPFVNDTRYGFRLNIG